jgi:cell division protein FtsL
MTAPWFVRALVPVPAPDPNPRPRLTVVPDPATLRARRLCRLVTALAGLAVCFGLFGVVIVQAMLAKGQGDVQRLKATVQAEQDRLEKLELEAGQLEAPARVVGTAREKLGMVAPAQVVMLGPADLANPPATTIPAPRATTTTVAAARPTTTPPQP